MWSLGTSKNSLYHSKCYGGKLRIKWFSKHSDKKTDTLFSVDKKFTSHPWTYNKLTQSSVITV
jgi:hypothetical protein